MLEARNAVAGTGMGPAIGCADRRSALFRSENRAKAPSQAFSDWKVEISIWPSMKGRLVKASGFMKTLTIRFEENTTRRHSFSQGREVVGLGVIFGLGAQTAGATLGRGGGARGVRAGVSCTNRQLLLFAFLPRWPTAAASSEWSRCVLLFARPTSGRRKMHRLPLRRRRNLPPPARGQRGGRASCGHHPPTLATSWQAT